MCMPTCSRPVSRTGQIHLYKKGDVSYAQGRGANSDVEGVTGRRTVGLSIEIGLWAPAVVVAVLNRVPSP